LSGAHLKFTRENIAVRAYYPCDIHESSTKEGGGGGGEDDDVDDDNFDDLETFLKFQLAIVLFILPSGSPIYHQQLDDTKSYFHRAQRLVMKHSTMSINATVRFSFLFRRFVCRILF
jgi:hypothetical protein